MKILENLQTFGIKERIWVIVIDKRVPGFFPGEQGLVGAFSHARTFVRMLKIEQQWLLQSQRPPWKFRLYNKQLPNI